MTTTEIENLKAFFADKFNDLKERYEKLESDIPRIAKEQAQSIVTQTAFIKPAEKIMVAIALLTVLLTAFGSYGKLSSMMDRFDRLEKRIEQKQVIESSDWVNTNRDKLGLTLERIDKRLDEAELKIRLITNGKNQNFIR